MGRPADRTERLSHRHGLALVLCVLATGCATAEPGAGRVVQRLDADLKACTGRHGYDPQQAATLAPHQLGTGERPWRACVYSGIEAHVIAKSFAPDAYRRVIEQDRILTDRVAAGTMTRADRRAALQAAFEAIDREEQAAAARAMSDPVRRLEEEQRRRDIQRSLMGPLSR